MTAPHRTADLPPRPGAERRGLLLSLGVAPFVALLLCLVFGALLAFLWTRTTTRGLGAITEPQAIAVFQQHRAACEGLRELAGGGDLVLHRGAHVPGEKGVKGEQLLAELGADNFTTGRRTQPPFTCEIELASHGNFFHRTRLSLVYLPGDQPPRDRPAQREGDPLERFTPLGEGWYLRYAAL